MCNFTAKTAGDFMKHVEEHNRENEDSSLPCELFDYRARTAQNFKEHIEIASSG